VSTLNDARSRGAGDSAESIIARDDGHAGSQQLVTLPSGVTPLLNVAEAARYLGLSVGHLQARGDIPRVNVAAPESHKPAWRYRVVDLERFAELRLVNPYRTHDDQERDSQRPRSGVEKR
jgi:hypothetical protein